MARIKSLSVEFAGLVTFPDSYENVRVHYGETIELDPNDDPDKVRRRAIARVRSVVEEEAERIRAEANKVRKQKSVK